MYILYCVSSINGHLSSFDPWAIVINASMNIDIQASVQPLFSIRHHLEIQNT